MSSTNKTTYYDLPQFVDNDIFNPLVDDNDAYDKIDTVLHNIADAEANDASEIVGIKSKLDSAEGDIDALEAQNGDSVLTTTAQTLSGAVNELDADVSALDGRLDIVNDDINNVSTGLKAKVTALETQNGSDVLTTDAQTLSGAVNELVTSDANIVNLIKTGFVTPEMYGAVGDGVTDDTVALTNAFNSGKSIILGKDKTYLISSQIQITYGNRVILGNNSKILANTEIGLLHFHYDVKDVIIAGVDFEAPIPVVRATCLVGFSKKDNNAYIGDSAKNIVIENCSFAGSTIQLQFNSVTNAKVLNCIFKDTGTLPNEVAGGYCILLQSSYDIDIENCYFTEQKHVRHKIYVSVDSTNTNMENVNVSIKNNIFDDTEQLYDATNTSAINVRMSKRVVIENNTFIKCVGISVTSENGDIYIDILHNTFIDTVFRSSDIAPSETRSAINIIGNTYATYFNVDGNKEIGTNIGGSTFISIGEGNVNTGRVVNNSTVKSNKHYSVLGKIYADNNKNGGGDLYRFEHNDVTFNGQFGDNFESTAQYPIYFTGNTKLHLWQMPQRYLKFYWNYRDGNDIIAWDKKIADYQSIKNGTNDFTLRLPWCSDSACRVIANAPDGDYFVKVVSMEQNNGLKIRVKCVAFDGTDFTGTANFGFTLVPIY